MKAYAINITGKVISRPTEVEINPGGSLTLNNIISEIHKNKYGVYIYNRGEQYLSGSINALWAKRDGWYNDISVRRSYTFL